MLKSLQRSRKAFLILLNILLTESTQTISQGTSGSLPGMPCSNDWGNFENSSKPPTPPVKSLSKPLPARKQQNEWNKNLVTLARKSLKKPEIMFFPKPNLTSCMRNL